MTWDVGQDRRSPILIVSALLWMCVLPHDTRAAELKLDNGPYKYTVVDQDLRDVLQQFASNVHLRLDMSDTVKGRVRGGTPTSSPRRFLDALAAEYGFDWYYDGSKLYVAPNSENVSKIIGLSHELFEPLNKALESGGISDSRFPLRELAGTSSVIVSGPPHFVDLVEQAVAALTPAKAPAAEASKPGSVVIYRGTGAQKTEFPPAEAVAR